jgi:hypothetical protein
MKINEGDNIKYFWTTKQRDDFYRELLKAKQKYLIMKYPDKSDKKII